MMDQSSALASAARSIAFWPFHATRQRAEQNRACSRRGANNVPHCSQIRVSPTRNYVTRNGPESAPHIRAASGAHPAAPEGGPPVGEDLAHDVAAGYAGDAASAVGGRPGLVQAADRGAQVGVAGRGPGVAPLAQAQLAVDDVPADQPVLLL